MEGFILIGGKSSRMGEDKFALKLNGKTFLQIACSTLENAGIKKISVVVSEETKFNFEFPIIKDIYKNRGALSGIHSALVNTKFNYIFVLACDYPFVSDALIKFLLDSAKTDPEFEAIIPIQPDGKVQPLCAVYKTKPCQETLSKMLESKTENYSVRDFLDKLKTHYIEFEKISHLPNSENFFFNVNTPEDFILATKLHESCPKTELTKIVRMTVDDLDTVIKIQEESKLSYWSYESYKDEINLESSFTVVAKIDNQTVGFLVGRLIIEENCAELYNIGIDLHFRQKSIGTKLIESFIKSCVDNKLEKIFLEVRESNETAIQFYLKHNFSSLSKRKNFYSNPTEDAILMVKEFSSTK